MNKILNPWWFAAILAGCCFLILRTCSLERRADALQADVKIAFSSSPSPSFIPFVPRPVPSVDPAEEADLRHHRSAIDRCNAEHRVPVIGYGWRIVCVDPKFIAWQEGPIAGHDPGGL